MSSSTSSALLSKAFKRGDFTLRGLVADLKEKQKLRIDHKTIGSYVLGTTRPKASNYRQIANVAFKSRKEREEYLSRWHKETAKEEKQSRKQKETWQIIRKAKLKGVFATALVTRGGKLDDQHKLETPKEENALPKYKPKMKASILVKRKKEVEFDGKKLTPTSQIIEIHSDGSISLHCATWSDQRNRKYWIADDMVKIMKILREYCTKEGLEPRGLFEIAKKELDESPWLDPETHSEGKRVLIDIYTLMDTQAFLNRAAEGFRKGEKDLEQADRFDFWAGHLEGYLQPELLVAFKQKITETLLVLLNRFPA